MESRNQQPVSGMSDGSTSVVLSSEPCKSRLRGLSCQLQHTHSYSHLAVVDGIRTCWTDDLRICSEMDMRFFPHPHPEQLADAFDDAPTRRAWWLNLHSNTEMLTGTTVTDLQAAVGRTAGSKTATGNGSNGQPAAAPVSFAPERCACNGPGCPDCSAVLTMPVCACSQPVASLRPFDWQCAKCKGVIPSPYILADEQRRDYVEAL